MPKKSSELTAEPESTTVSALSTTVLDHKHKYADVHHYSELARITAWLYLGVLALMTFLLTAGLQHPQKWFSTFIYSSIIILPLGLIAFTIGHSVHQGLLASDNTEAKAWKKLNMIRRTQQLLFILTLVVVTGLALASAHIFFAPAPTSAQPTTQGQ